MKAAIKAVDNSTCLHSDSFKINTVKSQGNTSVLVAQIRENISSLESDQKDAEHITEEYVVDSKMFLIQHIKIITQKNATQKIQ